MQSWTWAPLRLSCVYPSCLWNMLYLPNYSAQNVTVTLKLILAHLKVRGETRGTWITQRPFPNFSSTNATWSLMQSWSIFFQRNSFLLWNPNVLKIRIIFSDFCQKLSQFLVSGSTNTLLSLHWLLLYGTMTYLRRKNQVRFCQGEFLIEWKFLILVSSTQNWKKILI